jgi:hypothetical protein
MSASSPKSCVLVLGMHRSGTSALTGALHKSGLRVTMDILPANGANPLGYFESRSLMDVNDRILAELGGEWSAPPDLEEGFEQTRQVVRLSRLARATLEQVLPAGAVWKDPRNCLLMPIWRQMIDQRSPALLIWREPSEVAGSLGKRSNDLPGVVGLALWARYNRDALRGLEGRRVLVLSYEGLLGDPNLYAAEVVSFLRSGGLDLPLRDTAEEDFARHLDPSLRHHRSERSEQGVPLLADQQELREILRQLDGVHEAFDAPAMREENPWASALLGDRPGMNMLSKFGPELKLFAPLLRASRSAREASRPFRHRLRARSGGGSDLASASRP